MAIAYLSSAAFVVGRRSRFDRRVLRPAPSTWRSTFRRLLEGASATASTFALRPRRPTPCISGLALREAGGDRWRLWTGLGEAGCGCASSLAALGGPAPDCWLSSATPGKSCCD